MVSYNQLVGTQRIEDGRFFIMHRFQMVSFSIYFSTMMSLRMFYVSVVFQPIPLTENFQGKI